MGTERRPGEQVIRRERKQPGAAGRASQLPLSLASPDAESTLRRTVLTYLASFLALALTTADDVPSARAPPHRGARDGRLARRR